MAGHSGSYLGLIDELVEAKMCSGFLLCGFDSGLVFCSAIQLYLFLFRCFLLFPFSLFTIFLLNPLGLTDPGPY